MKHLMMLATLVAAAGAAQAGQAIYRCGQTYSQTPCPDGNGTIVESTDPRTAAQRAEAKRVAAKEKQLAAKMERERKEREAATVPQGAASVSAPLAPASAPASEPAKKGKTTHKAKSKKKAAADSKDFIAVVPGSKKKS